jgi:hypothetical protein
MKLSNIINPKKEDSYGRRQKKTSASFAYELKLIKMGRKKVEFGIMNLYENRNV